MRRIPYVQATCHGQYRCESQHLLALPAATVRAELFAFEHCGSIPEALTSDME